MGADARIALSVGQARGAALVAAATVGIECAEYAPARVNSPSAAMAAPTRARCSAWSKMPARARRASADLARGGRPRRRHLPRVDAAPAPPDGLVIARLRGTAAGGRPDGLLLDVNGVGYLVAATPLGAAPGGRRRRVHGEDVPPCARRCAAAVRLCRRRGATALPAAPHRQRHRPEGRARRRLRVAHRRSCAARSRSATTRVSRRSPGSGKKTAERIVLELREQGLFPAEDPDARFRRRPAAISSRATPSSSSVLGRRGRATPGRDRPRAAGRGAGQAGSAGRVDGEPRRTQERPASHQAIRAEP